MWYNFQVFLLSHIMITHIIMLCFQIFYRQKSLFLLPYLIFFFFWVLTLPILKIRALNNFFYIKTYPQNIHIRYCQPKCFIELLLFGVLHSLQLSLSVTEQPCAVLLPTTHKFRRQRFGEKGKASFYLMAIQFWNSGLLP